MLGLGTCTQTCKVDHAAKPANSPIGSALIMNITMISRLGRPSGVPISAIRAASASSPNHSLTSIEKIAPITPSETAGKTYEIRFGGASRQIRSSSGKVASG